MPTEVKNPLSGLDTLETFSAGRDIIFAENNEWLLVDDLIRIEDVIHPNARGLEF